ncbi:MAG TPA: class I SAM-dependent methyltransferase [Steroidobacteraceae bacterium]|nr:class I SAM-dependent methyltransferase [Steroidobacteraceae bacterium]
MFDSVAEAYDGQFTHTRIGAAMRAAVWARCAARFRPGFRILEMNCGTGEDAGWLANQGMQVLATDISARMIEVAHRKLDAQPQRAAVQFRRLAWEELGGLDAGPFDGMLSNFGGLNCVSDLKGAACALAGRLRPGATAILCIMGPHVPWEWLWFLARGRPAAAFRRLHRSREWAGVTIRYPSIGAATAAFAPGFRPLRVSAIGALLPPPYTEGTLRRYPRLLDTLERIERRFETRWPLPRLADHYLLELERV